LVSAFSSLATGTLLVLKETRVTRLPAFQSKRLNNKSIITINVKKTKSKPVSQSDCSSGLHRFRFGLYFVSKRRKAVVVCHSLRPYS
jgi:hypothetical protein